LGSSRWLLNECGVWLVPGWLRSKPNLIQMPFDDSWKGFWFCV